MTHQEDMEEQVAEELAEEDILDEQPESCEQAAGADEPAEKSESELLKEQVANLNDQLLRTMAEYDNFRRRSQREKDGIYPMATANTVAQFVPVLDTFDRALDAPCSDEEFKKGIVMIRQNFMDILEKLGVEAFGEAGDPFSPELFEAVMHVEDAEYADNVVVEVFQKGYKMGDRVIRHAVVKVAN